jgi:RimJ/RimL family protein N-acetyltransferase
MLWCQFSKDKAMARIPLLETERLIIRELTSDDLHAVHRILDAAFGTATVLAVRRRWLEWTALGYEMFAMLEQPHYGERGIALKATGELIGAIGIVPYRERFGCVAALGYPADAPATAEVGLFWAVAPEQQGRGYASETARALAAYLFTHEHLGRVIATTDPDNLASQGVMRKLGMMVERLEPPQPPGPLVVGVLENPELRQGPLG